MGPNGAGKSILMRLLHGLEKPSSGEVLFNGINLNNTIRLKQAMVFQNAVLLRRTVIENLSFVANLQRPNQTSNLNKLLQEVGLYEKKNLLYNEVFIQKYISNAKLSGVIFTCGLSNGNPYYYLNYDEKSKKTDSVTSGKTNELKNFILPGGNILVSYVHLARCVCRRAERCITELNESSKVINKIIAFTSG